MSVSLTRVRYKKRRTTVELGRTSEPVSTAATGVVLPVRSKGEPKYHNFSLSFQDAKTAEYYYLNVDRENAARIVKCLSRYLNETE